MKSTLLLSIVAFFTLAFSWNVNGQVPVITTFSPASGPVGTTVTISGTNFDPIAANNIAYFGAVKATVTAATTTSLSVTVPTGATYQLITVTTRGLTTYSSRPFTVTFPNNNQILSSGSFSQKLDFAAPGTNTFGNIPMVDLDEDGKTDLILSGTLGVSVLRNTGTGTIYFSSKLDLVTGSQITRTVATGDFDGDGKKDIAIANYSLNTISVFRKISTVGNIAFAAKVDFPAGTNPYGIAAADIDGDGKQI
jgi:hypothetical protein